MSLFRVLALALLILLTLRYVNYLYSKLTEKNQTKTHSQREQYNPQGDTDYKINEDKVEKNYSGGEYIDYEEVEEKN